MKTKVMFDTNAFDLLQKSMVNLQQLSKKYSFYISRIQIEEIAAIPDTKKDVREKNVVSIIELHPTLIPTPFSWDAIDFSHFSFQREGSYWKILKETKANLNDALIAATAIHEDCTLITEDTELLRKMRALNKPAMTFSEFITDL